MRPNIIILGTNNKMDDAEFIYSLEDKNVVFNEAKLKVEFRMKPQRGETVILSVKPDPFHQVMKG